MDDNHFSIVAIKVVLSLLNSPLEADSANNSHEALEAVKSKHRSTGKSYRLILIDYSIPFKNGPEIAIEICEYLRSQAPALERPYICCFSSIEDKQCKEEVLSAGMDKFID